MLGSDERRAAQRRAAARVGWRHDRSPPANATATIATIATIATATIATIATTTASAGGCHGTGGRAAAAARSSSGHTAAAAARSRGGGRRPCRRAPTLILPVAARPHRLPLAPRIRHVALLLRH